MDQCRYGCYVDTFQPLAKRFVGKFEEFAEYSFLAWFLMQAVEIVVNGNVVLTGGQMEHSQVSPKRKLIVVDLSDMSLDHPPVLNSTIFKERTVCFVRLVPLLSGLKHCCYAHKSLLICTYISRLSEDSVGNFKIGGKFNHLFERPVLNCFR